MCTLKFNALYTICDGFSIPKSVLIAKKIDQKFRQKKISFFKDGEFFYAVVHKRRKINCKIVN